MCFCDVLEHRSYYGVYLRVLAYMMESFHAQGHCKRDSQRFVTLLHATFRDVAPLAPSGDWHYTNTFLTPFSILNAGTKLGGNLKKEDSAVLDYNYHFHI